MLTNAIMARLQRPGSSHSANLPEHHTAWTSTDPAGLEPRPLEAGIETTPHEYAHNVRRPGSRAGGAVAVRGPPRAAFDRFYNRRRGRTGVVGGEGGATEKEDERGLVYPGRSGGVGGGQRWKRNCGIGLALVVMVAVALGVGLGVGLSRRHHSSPAPPPPTPSPSAPPDPSPHCPENNGTLHTSHGQSFQQLCDTDFKAGEPAISNARRQVWNLPASSPSASASSPATPTGATVQDLPAGPEGDANHTSGLVRNTFVSCVDACALWNVQNGYAPAGQVRRSLLLLQGRDRGSDDSSLSSSVLSPTATASSTGSNSAPTRSAAAASSSTTGISTPKCHGVTYIGNMTWVNEGVPSGSGQNRNCYLKSARPEVGLTVGQHDDTASALLLE